MTIRALSFLPLLLFFGCSQTDGPHALKDHSVVEPYHPKKKVTFPHDIHTGVNGIDCKYCHNSEKKGRGEGLPTQDVCLNCHKTVTGNGMDTAAGKRP